VCPLRPAVLARVGAVAGATAAAATIAFVIAVAAPVALLEPAAWPLAETSAAVVIGAGVVGGSLVPWLPERAVEQVASYVVVGGLAALGSYALSAGAGPAAAVGIPEALFALVAANAALVACVAVAGALER
jgi:hypothetical protein